MFIYNLCTIFIYIYSGNQTTVPCVLQQNSVLVISLVQQKSLPGRYQSQVSLYRGPSLRFISLIHFLYLLNLS